MKDFVNGINAILVFEEVQKAGKKHQLGHEFEFREGNLISVIFSRFGSNVTLRITRQTLEYYGGELGEFFDSELSMFNEKLDKSS